MRKAAKLADIGVSAAASAVREGVEYDIVAEALPGLNWLGLGGGKVGDSL